MKKIFVLGSVNIDLVICTDRVPQRGETVKGYGFNVNQGGKGANQAVACAKLGAQTHMLAAVGGDSWGIDMLKSLKSFGVNTSGVQTVKNCVSGVCVITLDKVNRDNYLIVDEGANGRIDIDAAQRYLTANASAGDIFISQFETPLDAVKKGLAAAKKLGMTTLLNPAPAFKVDGSVLQNTDILLPNETEAEVLTGVKVFDEKTALAAFEVLRPLGLKTLLVTLGDKGSAYVSAPNGGKAESKLYPIKPVKAVDTTSAGDTFIGAFAVKLGENCDVSEAIEYAGKCSAVTVQRAGAAKSIPTKAEAELYIKTGVIKI